MHCFLLWNFPSLWHLMDSLLFILTQYKPFHWPPVPLLWDSLACGWKNILGRSQIRYIFFNERATKRQHNKISVCCVVRSWWTAVACLCVCGQTVWLGETAPRALWGKGKWHGIAWHFHSFTTQFLCHTLKFVVLKKNIHYILSLFFFFFLLWNICPILLTLLTIPP